MNVVEAIHTVHVEQIQVANGLRRFGQRVDDIHELTSGDELSVEGKRVRDGLERDGLEAIAVLEKPAADPVCEARNVMRDAGLDWNNASTYAAILRQRSNEQYVLGTLKDSDPAKSRYERMVKYTTSRLPEILR